MIDRQTVYYYIGLVILCVVVVATVVFIVKPSITDKLDPVAQPKREAYDPTTIKKDPHEGTLAIMRTKYEGENAGLPVAADRNPFIKPGEIGPRKEAAAPKKVPALGMIIVGPERRLAFLDRKLVYEGQQHGGYRIERIASRAVTLSNAYGKLQLIAPEDYFGSAQVKRLERSRP